MSRQQGDRQDTLIGNDAFDVINDNNGRGEVVVDNTFAFFADWIDAV